MFFELRQYHIRPGQRETWVKCTEEVDDPLQVKMGMVVLGSSSARRTRASMSGSAASRRAERKRLYDAVYQSDYWKNDIPPGWAR